MKSPFARQVLEALQPAATPVGEDIIFWKPFDAAPVGYYVRFIGERAAKVNVKLDPKNPHDPARVIALLAGVKEAQLDAVSETQPLGLAPLALPGTAFTLQATVHPSLANGALSKPTEFMRPATFGILPAHRCEFTDNDTRDEAAFRLAKVVPWVDWNRVPAPAISARFLRKKTNIKSTGGKRLGVMKLEELERTVQYVATDDGFIEVENFERALLLLEHANGHYEVQQGETRWTPKPDALLPWLRIFVREGAAAAEAKRAEHVA